MCYGMGRMNSSETKALRRSGRNRAPAPRGSRWANERALGRLKLRLLRQLLDETRNPVLHASLHRAAAEAESLAWLSPVPLLVLPSLLEEKARAARRYASRQAELRAVSREWHSHAE